MKTPDHPQFAAEDRSRTARHTARAAQLPSRLLGSALAALCLVFASQTPASGAESAVWVKKKILFVYQGFTTQYSCEGLKETMRDVLLQLGARKSDMKINETGCALGFNVPSPSPGVSGTFYVLEPASSASSSGGSGHAGATVNAEWQSVTVNIARGGREESGRCELLEQVKKKVLPLFEARDVKFQSDCFPNQVTIGRTMLQAQLLKPAAAENHDVAGVAR